MKRRRCPGCGERTLPAGPPEKGRSPDYCPSCHRDGPGYPPRGLACKFYGDREEHTVNVLDSRGCRTCQCRMMVWKGGKWAWNTGRGS